jgi:adenine-specific DNA-methyltransferase
MSVSEEAPAPTAPDEPGRVDPSTPDLAAAKRVALEELLPGVLADGVLDATRLGELLDTPVTAPADGRERFGLMWAGKQDAVRSLLMPSRGALAPELDKSIDFDSAQNVFIEGDNLEVLKLLQKAYNDKVKLIYIDPPYNTGKDFVYPDDFSDGLRAYLRYTGQIDADGNRTSTDSELLGRRHSRWLSMMYPRLVLARNLLAQDGVLLCSINDTEFPNLMNLLREIFGEENFLATFVWNNDGNIEQQSSIKVNHEYIVAFARDESLFIKPTIIDPNISEASKLFKEQIENSITKNGPANPESTVLLPKGFPASADSFTILPRDDAFPRILDEVVVEAGELVKPARLRSGWSSRRLLDLFIDNGFIPIEDQEGKQSWFAITPTGAIYGYKKRSESQGHVLTVLRNMGTTKASSSQMKRQWGVVFDFPKPERLMQHLVAIFTSNEDLIVDFFAGSGATAHGVALQNKSDGGSRKYLLVNLPEPVSPDSEAGRAGFNTVADITLRRILGVAEAVSGASAMGLRVFRLAPSNFRGTAPEDSSDLLDLGESTLLDDEPTVESVAAEVLPKEGVALDARWERYQVAGADVIVADGVAVIVAVDTTDDVVAEALALQPRVLVFLEDGFAGKDAVKANAYTNARNLGITMKTV